MVDKHVEIIKTQKFEEYEIHEMLNQIEHAVKIGFSIQVVRYNTYMILHIIK